MDKVIWITGASSGFGLAVAQDLLAYTEHTICVSARRIDKLNVLKEKGAFIYPLDVTSEKEVKKTVNSIIDDHGNINAVLVNAGFGVYGTIEDVPKKDMIKQFEVNVYGAIDTINAVLPYMRENCSGRIVITSSTAAHISTKGTGYYAASKHSVRALGTALRQEVQDFGIDVVMVEPGIVKTDFKNSALENSYVDEPGSPYYKKMKELKRYFLDAFKRAPELSDTKDIMLYALLNDKVKPIYTTNFTAALQNHIIHLVPPAIYDKIISEVIKRF